MARAKQPVSVDDIEFDALIDSEEGYEADVPEYPTEKGFSVSDTIVLKADTLNMTLYVTDTPVTWRERTGSGPGKTEGVVRRLKDLYFAKKILEVTTTDCVYSNMVITSSSVVGQGRSTSRFLSRASSASRRSSFTVLPGTNHGPPSISTAMSAASKGVPPVLARLRRRLSVGSVRAGCGSKSP